ncbi:NIPSNAP family protein [Variovorax ginsengisoli]|uniref:NIPSNAP family protein n=1 Tax=Variovorax ginsengisoli TaxID=363844 RepID=A0ABT8S588_9BURK|nr:NIPSNAP family protein [Variovorax ginsengisoli]MDN8614906.1 NIPSNAP family protein [Variovorax ginsengisoli]MDO1534076.1 NIPSNAP family protein [Variovorax ginsengisoli]
MIYEERNYSFAPLNFRPFLRLFEDEGLALTCAHLGQLVGYFTAETGALNTAVHIWAFEDLADRERPRAAMWSDPEWLAYSAKVLPWIVRMENRLLKPTGFSPLQ